MDDIFDLIRIERQWQDENRPNFDGDFYRYSVLGEEVGEVAKALQEYNQAGRAYRDIKHGELIVELTQVASVAVRWLEKLVPREKEYHIGD